MNTVFAYKYTMSACLRVTDEDAAEFLQSQFSNDLRPFGGGQCTYGLWLDNRGKVIGDSYILCEGSECFWAFSEHSSGELIREKLEQHIIADDVELSGLVGGAALALIGPDAGALIASMGLEAPEVGAFIERDGLYLFRGRRSKQSSFELVATTDASKGELAEFESHASLRFVSSEWIQSERVSARFPWIPVEIGPTDLPGEGGLVPNVASLTKGCFLGQEVVARMHNVGRPQRALFEVSGEGAPLPTPMVIANEEGKNVGQLRSSFRINGGWRGVALLKIRYAEAGNSFLSEGGDRVVCVAAFD